MLNKNTHGLTADQLANGTPSDKVLILKAFYKDDKAVIAPAKDVNRRYLGIKENIPEIKKLEMGYVPDPTSRVRIYDGIEIDLNDEHWSKDWDWMQHCSEIAPDFASGQSTPGAYFYIYRPGLEAAKKVNTVEEEVKLLNYILQDSPENLYNRVRILGIDMSGEVISEVKDYLLSLAKTEPHKVQKVYESKTFSLELLLLNAIERSVVKKRNGTYTFGGILLGIDNNAVIAFFANPKNSATTKAIEALTYGNAVKEQNPLENESVGDSVEDYDMVEHAEKEDKSTSTVNAVKKAAAKRSTKK